MQKHKKTCKTFKNARKRRRVDTSTRRRVVASTRQVTIICELLFFCESPLGGNQHCNWYRPSFKSNLIKPKEKNVFGPFLAEGLPTPNGVFLHLYPSILYFRFVLFRSFFVRLKTNSVKKSNFNWPGLGREPGRPQMSVFWSNRFGLLPSLSILGF